MHWLHWRRVWQGQRVVLVLEVQLLLGVGPLIQLALPVLLTSRAPLGYPFASSTTRCHSLLSFELLDLAGAERNNGEWFRLVGGGLVAVGLGGSYVETAWATGWCARVFQVLRPKHMPTAGRIPLDLLVLLVARSHLLA